MPPVLAIQEIRAGLTENRNEKDFVALDGGGVCIVRSFRCFAPGANADQIVFTASMSGLNENPPNNTSGTGFAEVTLDTVLDTITVNLTWSGLTGPAAAGHIHGPAPVGTNAPVLFPLRLPTR